SRRGGWGRVLLPGRGGGGMAPLRGGAGGLWRCGGAPTGVPKGPKLRARPQRLFSPRGPRAPAAPSPAEPGTFGVDTLAEIITAVGLPALAGRLTEEAHWNRMLSLGEQQRLGIARAILQAPDYLFLDEATASLDEAAE